MTLSLPLPVNSEIELFLIDEQDARRRQPDHLGERSEVEYRLGRYRPRIIDAVMADCSEQDDVAVIADGDHGSGKRAVDLGAQILHNRGELGAVELRRGSLPGEPCGDRQREGDEGEPWLHRVTARSRASADWNRGP